MRNGIGDQRVPADVVSYELVVFERRGETLEVTVRGMTSAIDLQPAVCEGASRTEISVVGVPALGDVRPFEVRTSVTVRPELPVVVRGLHESDAMLASSLPEGLPVVCGADPTQAELSVDFLHRREDRYVLMHGSDACARGHRSFTKVA